MLKLGKVIEESGDFERVVSDSASIEDGAVRSQAV
jgi:hypothetical protein